MNTIKWCTPCKRARVFAVVIRPAVLGEEPPTAVRDVLCSVCGFLRERSGAELDTAAAS